MLGNNKYIFLFIDQFYSISTHNLFIAFTKMSLNFTVSIQL